MSKNAPLPVLQQRSNQLDVAVSAGYPKRGALITWLDGIEGDGSFLATKLLLFVLSQVCLAVLTTEVG